ncbi:MAG: DUF1080 domain-containing protein [Planctomycetia bacterium]|nr:DUF1080 domain-containing protein [Planctomycetia bacterium]
MRLFVTGIFRIFNVLGCFCVFGLILAQLVILPECAWGKNPAEVWNLEALKTPPVAKWSAVTEKVSENGENESVKKILVQKVWYTGEPFRGKDTRVFAFMARPEGDGPFPGIVLVHGGGGTAFSWWAEMWAERGYAAIAMDLAGCEVLEDGSREWMMDGGPRQGDDEKFKYFEENDYREMWSYHAIANIMKAHSLLIAQPYVDADRTAATGISWGGYLTSMVAGIDDRFKVVVPVYGCGDLERNSVWTERIEQIPWPGKDRWKHFFDPIQYVGNAKCRICFMAGTDDFAYPLDIHYNTYKKVRQAEVRLEVHMPHGHRQGADVPEIMTYIDSVILGTTGLPSVGELKWTRNEDGTISVSAPIVRNSSAAVSAKLHYTTDVGGYISTKWTNREWKELQAEIVRAENDEKDGKNAKNDTVYAQIPKEIAELTPLRVFLEVSTADGQRMSSHYAFCKPIPKPNFEAVPENGILLFGRNSAGELVNRFRDMSGGPVNWKVEDDTLISTKVEKGLMNNNHIHSDVDFRDARIHAEFQLPERGDGNSGLYIHGLYEMQILNSVHARDVNKLDAGAFYLFAPPITLASMPGGEWQSYDIIYRAPRRDENGKIVEKGRMTAWLNGLLVQDNFEFEDARSQWHPMRRQDTDHIRAKWEHQKKTGFAPLFLQDHNNATKFRNVWIVPMD